MRWSEWKMGDGNGVNGRLEWMGDGVNGRWDMGDWSGWDMK